MFHHVNEKKSRTFQFLHYISTILLITTHQTCPQKVNQNLSHCPVSDSICPSIGFGTHSKENIYIYNMIVFSHAASWLASIRYDQLEIDITCIPVSVITHRVDHKLVTYLATKLLLINSLSHVCNIYVYMYLYNDMWFRLVPLVLYHCTLVQVKM